MPTSSDIGMVTPSACGSSVQRIRPAVPQVTPLASRLSRYSITGGSTRRNVKISSARKNGGRISLKT